MDGKTILSHEELEALLGEENNSQALNETAAGIPQERNIEKKEDVPSIHTLVNAVRALSSRVEILEQHVRELRIEAIAREQMAREQSVPTMKEKAPVQASKTTNHQNEEKEMEQASLSRMKRYDKSRTK
ncbi:hypothetical protein [Paenibacillus abyssi]|nr:hypothetical protein [Paenibacillus abyssi]